MKTGGEGLHDLPPISFPQTSPYGKVILASSNPWLKRATELALQLARFPETSGLEFRSSRLISSFLRDAGFRIIRGLPDLPTAFLGQTGDSHHPKVCLIVEFDALPGLGQACGHNLNAAMAVLAAAMLAPMTRNAGGSLLVAGTPNEERLGAKTLMIRQGIFADVGLALLIHAGAWKSRLRYRTSAFRSLLFPPGQDEADPLEILKKHLKDGETVRIRTDRDTAASRLDILTPRIDRRDFLTARATELLARQEISPIPDAGEEPLEPFLPNRPAEIKLAALWQKMGIPFDDNPVLLGSSDMGNLSRCCPSHQSILAVTERPLAWHTTTFAATAGGPGMSRAILLGALSLVGMSLLFWQDRTFRMEVARAFLAGKALRIPS